MEAIAREPFPLFIVVGMPRGGTTFLYNVMGSHPSIFVPFRKEVNYFTRNYDRGEEWYLSLFNKMDQELIAGDFSPTCFMAIESIERIKKFNSNVKIIMVVRDPAEWALSLYQQFKSFTFNMPSLSEYLNGYDYIVGEKTIRVRSKDNHIVNTIEKFRQEFKDNMLMYSYSYFEKEPLKILKIIEEFLEIPSYYNEENFTNVRINASGRKNIKFLAFLLSREWFINLIEKLVPRRLVILIRGKFDTLSAKNKTHEKFIHPEENIALAKKELGSQCDAVRNFFSESPIVLGSGKPLL